MKCSKPCIVVSLAAIVSFAVLGGCTFFGSKTTAEKKPAKKETAAKIQPSPEEWKERKWEQYAEDRAGTIYYFEKESISYPAKNIIHLWRKRVMGPGGGGMKEITSYDELDCRTEKFRTLELQAINPNGTTTEIFRRPSPWNTVYQQSADEYILNNFCKEAAKAENTPKR